MNDYGLDYHYAGEGGFLEYIQNVDVVVFLDVSNREAKDEEVVLKGNLSNLREEEESCIVKSNPKVWVLFHHYDHCFLGSEVFHISNLGRQ